MTKFAKLDTFYIYYYDFNQEPSKYMTDQQIKIKLIVNFISVKLDDKKKTFLKTY